MHRFMNHLDELAGLDIVLARAERPPASVAQAPGLRRRLDALLLRLRGHDHRGNANGTAPDVKATRGSARMLAAQGGR